MQKSLTICNILWVQNYKKFLIKFNKNLILQKLLFISIP